MDAPSAVNKPSADVREVIAYGREKLAAKIYLMCLFMLAAGGLSLLVDDGRAPMQAIVGWGLVAGGVAWAAYEFSKTTQPPKPLLVLSPEGIGMRIEGARQFLIPWSEVRGVESIDVTGYRGARFRNVTAVLVTRAFYERVIHVDSFILRGPGWGSIFIPRGDDMMLVALHDSVLPVTAAELRTAVEARWRAFGPAPSPVG
jgi:hypothetical protein